MSASKQLDEERRKILGLVQKGKDEHDATLEVGDTVSVRGKIMRIHPSGFAVVEVTGSNGQPEILVHLGNTEKAHL